MTAVTAVTVPPAPTWPVVLARWSVEPTVVALLVVVTLAYGRGRRVLGQRGRRGPALFGAGIGAVAVALLSPLATYAHALLSVHMVQHLLLVVVAAPLLVAADPGPSLLAAVPARWRRLRPFTGHRPRPVPPVLAWFVFAATGWSIHFSPLFDLSLRHEAIHAVEHAVFLGTGLLFWTPVFNPRSRLSHPARLLYVALAMPQNTFLALAIYSADHPLYPDYVALKRPWGGPVLADQRLAGAIMWVAGDISLLVAVLFVAAAWASSESDKELFLNPAPPLADR